MVPLQNNVKIENYFHISSQCPSHATSSLIKIKKYEQLQQKRAVAI